MGYEKRLRTAGKRALRFVGKRFDDVIHSLEKGFGGREYTSKIHMAGYDEPDGVLGTLTENDPVMRLLRRPEFNDLMDRATMEKAVAVARELAENNAENQQMIPVNDPRALYLDPLTAVQQLGFRDRPSFVTYFLQELMVWRVPIVHAIIHTRGHQSGNLATPKNDKFELGYRVRLRNAEDHPTAADRKFMRFMSDAIYQSGTSVKGPYNMEAMLKMGAKDSLQHDQVNWEIIKDRNRRPAVWHPVDPKTMRLADTRQLFFDDDPDRINTVQVYDNVVIGEFTKDEMIFAVRNPRSDIRMAGYGTPEIEMLVTVVTSLINAFEYNSNFFTQGTVAKGLLNIKGSVPDRQMKAFKRLWFNMVSGVQAAWRSVVLNAEQVDWIPLHPNNRDMEFSSFFDFLIKLACAMYLTDPIEINFKYGTSQQRSMFEGAQRAKSQESRERGLRPLVRTFERMYNENIIWPWSDNFVMEFVGLEAQTPKELQDLQTQRVKNSMTINEVRAREDLAPLQDGNVMDNISFMAERTARVAREQMEKQLAQQAAMGAQATFGPGAAKQDLETALSGLHGGAAGGAQKPAAKPAAAMPQAKPAPLAKSLELNAPVAITIKL